MYPIILQVGPIIIYSLWFFAGLGFLVSVFMFTHLAKQRRLQMNFIYYYSFGIFLWGLIGARILFIAHNHQIYFSEFSTNTLLSTLYIWDKGLSFFGALIGITGALVYYTLKEHEQLWKWIDILTISIISGLIFGNIGAFLGAASYGSVTNLPWGVLIESPSVKYAVPIHPVQIYAAIYCLLITTALYLLYRYKKIKPGKLTVAGVYTYFTLLFIEGFLRGNDAIFLYSLRVEQWLSIMMIVSTSAYLIYRYNKKGSLNNKHQDA